MTLRPSSAGARGRRFDPFDRACRQVVEQVDDARQVELFEQLRDLRPDALQRLHLGEQRIEDFGAHARLLAPAFARSQWRRPRMTSMRFMPSEPELKRLHWRAHHRGTQRGRHAGRRVLRCAPCVWGAGERALFAEMLNEQDVDIMAWAHGTADAAGALRRSDDRGAAEARLHPDRAMSEPLQRVLRADQPLTLAGVPTGFLPWLAADLARAAHGGRRAAERSSSPPTKPRCARWRKPSRCSRPRSKC